MTQSEAVLMLLRSGPQRTSDFCSSLYRLSAEYRRVISTLRKQGYVIHAQRLSKSEWRYTLVAEPARVAAGGQMVFA